MNAMKELLPEFSYILGLDNIAPGGSKLALEADAETRKRLAERFDLLSLDRLVAQLTVTRGASGIPVWVRGWMEASVVQTCIVSLEPVPSNIKELIEVEYAPGATDEVDEEFSLDQPDPPEPLDGDRLELGELVVQHLSIGLDPYPRKAGADASDWVDGEGEQGENVAPSPFAILEQLRKKPTT